MRRSARVISIPGCGSYFPTGEVCDVSVVPAAPTPSHSLGKIREEHHAARRCPNGPIIFLFGKPDQKTKTRNRRRNARPYDFSYLGCLLFKTLFLMLGLCA